MTKFKIKLLAAAALALAALPARAQSTYPGVPVQPLGYCILSATQLAAAIGLSSCVSASFTGTGSGTTLTASAVSGIIKPGQTVTGPGVAVNTTIVAQLTGSGGCVPGSSGCTAGGAGTYQTSQATTANAGSLNSGGIPPGANSALLEADTANIRFRDDGGAPTSSQGIFLVGTASNNVPNQVFYSGTLSALQFIAATGSPVLHAAFYAAFRQ